MRLFQKQFMNRFLSLFILLVVSLEFCIPVEYVQAQMVLSLPVPGAMLNPSSAFIPPVLKGLILHPQNPFQFDFIMDTGDRDLSISKLKNESNRLIKYFLAAHSAGR